MRIRVFLSSLLLLFCWPSKKRMRIRVFSVFLLLLLLFAFSFCFLLFCLLLFCWPSKRRMRRIRVFLSSCFCFFTDLQRREWGLGFFCLPAFAYFDLQRREWGLGFILCFCFCFFVGLQRREWGLGTILSSCFCFLFFAFLFTYKEENGHVKHVPSDYAWYRVPFLLDSMDILQNVHHLLLPATSLLLNTSLIRHHILVIQNESCFIAFKPPLISQNMPILWISICLATNTRMST